MTPDTTNGGKPSRSLLPNNAKDPTKGSGGFSPSAYVPTPNSEVGTGQTPPPSSVSGRPDYTNDVGSGGIGGGRGGTPVQRPGTNPPSGLPRSPQSVTSPSNKSLRPGVDD